MPFHPPPEQDGRHRPPRVILLDDGPWPWLQERGDSHHSPATLLTFGVIHRTGADVGWKLERLEEYRDRWDDDDLLAALDEAARVGSLDPRLDGMRLRLRVTRSVR